MKALRLTSWGTPAKLCDLPIPDAGPGEVVVEIAASGACHSDVHLMTWPEGQLPWHLPFTLGHENAGRIHAVGPGVVGWQRGDAVLIYGPWGCGTCRACRLGRENYCERANELRGAGGGLGFDGGMATYMRVPNTRHLVPLGDFDPVRAAPLADAALTPYHAIASARDRLAAGSTAIVIGAGGLGQMAVQLLRQTTPARVVVIDTNDAKLELARMYGADRCIRGGGDTDKLVRECGPAELVLDIVGSQATLALGARLLRPEGRLAIVGLGGGVLPMGFFAVPYGAQVTTSYWGTYPELVELVALARAGRLRIDVEAHPLDQALEVYERLRDGKITGRAVLIPPTT
ncbi:MAG: NAD(P)-dependent alcohol dehydrogenase [Kofleriaceae bacterium]